jgi:hypothetical protein
VDIIVIIIISPLYDSSHNASIYSDFNFNKGKMTKTKDPDVITLESQVMRSLSTVRKKDMSVDPPTLSSTDDAALGIWAAELMIQAGPKKTDEKDVLDFFKSIPLVLKTIGTHAFKLPNPDVSTVPIYSDFQSLLGANRSIPGVLYEDLLPENLVYAGDASKIRLAKFLLAKINLDGQLTSVLDQVLLGSDSSITKALVKAGMPTLAIDLVAQVKDMRAQQSIKSIPVHPLTKQIYFEEEGFDDVMLIPVASERMIAEMHHQASVSGRWMASRALCAVGGANPVNGGALCSDLGGAFQILEASPPNTPDVSIAGRITRGGNLYTPYSVSDTDVLTFVKCAGLEQSVGNAKQRATEIKNYEWFADVLLAPLLAADAHVHDGLSSQEHGAIGNYLRRDVNSEVQNDLAQDVSVAVLDYIVKNNKSLRAHISDVHIRSMLIEKMTEALV